jgi:hypothetical protein
MTTPAASKIDGYIKLDGSFAYCDDDPDKKCVDGSQVCSTGSRSSDEKNVYNGSGMMSCGNWWGSGYWTGWWNWSYSYGFLGDNLIFLYSEVDAPDEYVCGYPRNCGTYGGFFGWSWWWWFGGFSYYCSEDTGDCNYPRIKSCKTNRCVDNTYGYYYSSSICDYINGKDRADRCCKKPENFSCKEGECDYEYEIVKKTYSIEYELVKPSYWCQDPPELPATSCTPIQNVINFASDKCYETKSYCGPKNKCPTISTDEKNNPKETYWCDPDATKPSKGYTELADEPFAVVWDYPPKDCNTNCSRCIPCDEDDCTFAYYDTYNWGWGGWSFFNNIGTDCCDSGGLYGRPSLCPSEIIDDGSGNPWWCSGTDCVQMAEGEETEGFTGPFTSRISCMSKCNEDTNKCIPPDPSITRGLCCDKKFMDQMEKALEETQCNEQIERKTQNVTQILCTGNDGISTSDGSKWIPEKSGADVVVGSVNFNNSLTNFNSVSCENIPTFKYTKEICGYQPKYAEVEKTIHTRSNKIYEYAPEIPKQYFQDFAQCGSVVCDQDAYAQCRKNFADTWGGNDCPSNSKTPLIKQNGKFNAQEIVSTATVSVVVVFCKVTTKPCAPSEEE